LYVCECDTSEFQDCECDSLDPAYICACDTSEFHDCACDRDQKQRPTSSSVSFSDDIIPVFNQYCYACHNGSDGNIANFSTETLFTELGYMNDYTNPERSLYISYMRNGEMPPSGSAVPSETIDIIVKWIAEGAKEN